MVTGMWIRVRGPVAAVATGAVLVAACSSASDLATVDGVGISRGDVLAMRAPVEGPTAPAATIRQDLSTLILEQSLASAAEEQFGVVFTTADVEARLADPPDRYVQLFEQLAADPTVGEGLTELNARFTLVRDAVIPELLLEQRGSYQAVIEESPGLVMRACVSHIVVATEEDAHDVLTRITAGEGFATVAAEVSLDQQSPGGLLQDPQGCLIHHGQMGGEFVEGVIAAPLGEPAGPLSTSSGFHVLMVDERSMPTPGEMAADPMVYLDAATANDLMGPWFIEAVASADVDVRSTVGVWSAESSSVVAAQ